ncbi:MAG: isoaspartyl peptidase/L-asparaginase [Hyphomicrobiaceae bacterium]
MSEAIAIGIHGGCGTLERAALSDAAWAEARAHLAASLKAGWAVLVAGGSSIDAVEAAVVVMEDSPHFNAGHGAALNEDGFHELDASIMDGSTMAAGGVCAVRRIRNPVKAARAVMERTGCVLIAADAADAFARSAGLAMVDNRYFTTERRVAALKSLKERAVRGTIGLASEAEKHGTVGAVARDRTGALASATSTGGYNNKPTGRVGDSPIIGAGTYAVNGIAAVSCTGMGEAFIRHAVGHDIVARMRYAGADLETATGTIIHEVMPAEKVGAGLVAVDAAGRVLAPFNTLGMYRGWIMADGQIVVGTHGETVAMGCA